VTLAEARALLRRVTYRPKYVFEIKLEPCGLIISMNACVEDATRPNRSLMLGFGRFVPDLHSLNERAFLAILEQIAEDHDRHERKEWLRLDGVPVSEPHPLP